MSETLSCPDKPRFAGDIVGCGSTNLTASDDEGLVDCLECGLWFKPSEENDEHRRSSGLAADAPA